MIEEIQGYYVRTSHDDDCDGWVLWGFRTLKGGGGKGGPRPDYAPCEICRPGQRAVWEANLMIPRIDESPEKQTKARNIFIQAEREAGNNERAEHIEAKMSKAKQTDQRQKESEGSWV